MISGEGRVFLCHTDMLFPPFSFLLFNKAGQSRGDVPSAHMNTHKHTHTHTHTHTHIHTHLIFFFNKTRKVFGKRKNMANVDKNFKGA